MRTRRRAGTALALVVMAAFLGVGLALLAVTGVLMLSVAAANATGDGRSSLHAPGVALALGTELIAGALLVGWRAGGRRGEEEEDEDLGPAFG